MKLAYYVLAISLIVSCAHESPRTPSTKDSPKYGPSITPLSLDHKNVGENFWKIIPYYRSQKTDASCSLASITMIINALIPSHTLSSATELFTEKSLIEKSESKSWKQAVEQGGMGMRLNDLNSEIEHLLIKLSLTNYATLYREMTTEEDSYFFQSVLEKHMKGEGWIILNYDQGVVMGEGSYGHFSPVASYDGKSQRVLILDTDATWYEPYWVPLKLLTKSMNTFDHELKNPRGFIWIYKK